jgi:hypothetical protein
MRIGTMKKACIVCLFATEIKLANGKMEEDVEP